MAPTLASLASFLQMAKRRVIRKAMKLFSFFIVMRLAAFYSERWDTSLLSLRQSLVKALELHLSESGCGFQCRRSEKQEAKAKAEGLNRSHVEK